MQEAYLLLIEFYFIAGNYYRLCAGGAATSDRWWAMQVGDAAATGTAVALAAGGVDNTPSSPPDPPDPPR